jgi:hypothetical protein
MTYMRLLLLQELYIAGSAGGQDDKVVLVCAGGMRSCLLCHASVILCVTPATVCIWCGCRSLHGWWHSCHADNDDAGKGEPTVTLHSLTLGLFDHHVSRVFGWVLPQAQFYYWTQAAGQPP